ncbi:MAG: antitoxin [Actinobacteria bacterium]|nr:antitoxin [Actinomycetota bacterium]
MSKRLQVLLDEHEFDAIRQVAAAEGVTVSEWVRQVLRRARRERPSADAARKLAAIRAAARHDFPTADIDQMLTEIEAGYLGR